MNFLTTLLIGGILLNNYFTTLSKVGSSGHNKGPVL